MGRDLGMPWSPKLEEQEVPYPSDITCNSISGIPDYAGAGDSVKTYQPAAGHHHHPKYWDNFDFFASSDPDDVSVNEDYSEEHKSVLKLVDENNDDDDDNKDNYMASLNLSLNYQDVLDAWSDRGTLWAHHNNTPLSLSNPNNNPYMGEVPVMDEERSIRREASVMRYKEKRHTRLFSKKIRYQVRKLNAQNRPRHKGRFVRKAPDGE